MIIETVVEELKEENDMYTIWDLIDIFKISMIILGIIFACIMAGAILTYYIVEILRMVQLILN